jgi:hypothetical protein
MATASFAEDDAKFLAAKELPTQACQNSPVFKDFCGSDIALLRTIRKTPDNRSEVWYAGDSKSNKEDRNPPVEFTVDQSDPNNIVVNVTLPKNYLRTGLPDNGSASDPLEVISVSVTGKSGTNSCYWDCYLVNGKKKCDCINY